jgi:hypothetical protein
MKRMRHVERVGEKRNALRILVGKFEEKEPSVRSKLR